MKKINFKIIAAAVIAFAAGMLCCLALLSLVMGGGVLKSSLKFAGAMKLVKTKYVGDADVDELTDTALSAAFSTLDNWSYYMTAEEYDSYIDYINNRYQGIGVTVQKNEENGGFEIMSLSSDGPAALAGVCIGEFITAVNGEDVTEKTVSELKTLIRAEYGGEVELTLLSADGTSRQLAVKCEQIDTEPVSYAFLDSGVGYIRIENFEAGVADAAIDALDALTAENVPGVVIDVRSNPGGRVTELCELLDYLLPEGEIFVSADKKGHESVTSSDADFLDVSLAVLVDENSYSAAEYFAAVLREYDRAVVVGQATTGKGRSQYTYKLFDGSAVHLSHHVYLTPDGVDLAETGGIVPDTEITLSDEKLSAFAAGTLDYEDDDQLQAAADILFSGLIQ